MEITNLHRIGTISKIVFLMTIGIIAEQSVPVENFKNSINEQIAWAKKDQPQNANSIARHKNQTITTASRLRLKPAWNQFDIQNQKLCTSFLD